MYYFDQYGWLTSQPIEGRSTDVAPPVETQTLKANWTGVEWVLVEYTAPPAPPAAPEAAWAWFIDIGPFFDRFGAAKMAVLTSADAGVKAILQDVQIRKWVDLKRSDVISSLAYIGSKVPSVDATLQSAILNTAVADAENLALRKLYFS